MNNYTPLDLNDLAGVHNLTSKSGMAKEDSTYLRLPDGDCAMSLRLLPGHPGKRPYHMFQAHKVNGKFMICRRVPQATPERMIWIAPPDAKDCPVCQYYKSKYKKYNPGKPPKEVEDVLKEIKPMVRVSWNVIARDLNNKKNVGPLIWTCGIQVAQKIWAAILGDTKTGRRPKGDIFHPDTGRDFLLIKKSKGGSTFPEYSESEILEQCAAGTPEEWQRWLKSLHDLEAASPPADYETLRHALAVHLGTEDDEEDGDDIVSQFEKKKEAPVKEAPVKIKPQVKQVEKTDQEELVIDPEFQKELDAMQD